MASITTGQSFPPLSIKNICGPLFIAIGGAGANTGILVGKDNILLIDAKMTSEAVEELAQAIKTQFNKPVSVIVLTHSDIDHVGGIDSWESPFKLIAQEDTNREIIAQLGRVPVNHLPDEIFTDAFNFNFEGNPIELVHVGPAHTGGDSIVVFPALRTIFTGDLLFINREPLIHRQKGGSSAGLVRALDVLLGIDADWYASGHSDPVKKAEVSELRNAISAKRVHIKSLASEGKTWEEVKAIIGEKDFDPPPGRPKFPSLAEVIYQETIISNAG